MIAGRILTWTTSDCSLDTMRQALTAAGLDPALAKELDAKSAFSRASKHLKDGRVIDKVKEKGDTIEFQLTKATLDNERMDYTFETVISLDKETGSIHCNDQDIADAATKLFHEATRLRTAQDITHIVQKLCKENADLFPINPEKGVAYFVPEAHADFITKITTFLRQCGGRVSLWPVPHGDMEGERAIQDAVNTGIDAMISELGEGVEEWSEKTRKSTQERATTKLRTIRAKIEAYSHFLDKKRQELDGAVDSLRDKMLAKLDEAAA